VDEGNWNEAQIESVPEPEPLTLPWQERERYSSAFMAAWETCKKVLFDPAGAFKRVRVEGSLGESLVFVLILGTIGGILGALWQFGFQMLQWGASMGPPNAAPPQMALPLILALVLFGVLFVPVGVVIGSFINAGIMHLCLMIVGARPRSFEATYAVVAYGQGCTALFNVVPLCGGLIGGIWYLVVQVMGQGEIHGTSTGKALLAVLLPMIFCCGLFIVLAIVLVGVGALAGSAGP
jgi:hypothetical protein